MVPEPAQPIAPATPRLHQRWRLWCSLTVACATPAALLFWPTRGYGPFFYLWLLALGGYVACFPGAERRYRGPVSRSAKIVLLLLMVLAVGLRLPAVDRIPPNIAVDELLPGYESWLIASGDYPNVVSHVGWFTIPGLTFTPAAMLMRALPVPPFYALRLASVITALFGLLFSFLLARRLFNARTALVAFFLMSVAFWHLHNSRTGFPFIQTSAVIPGVLYLLVRARQDRSLRCLAAAGISLGLALQGYFPVRALLLLVPLFLLSGWIRQRERPARVVIEGGVLALGAFLSLAPLVLWNSPAELFGRSQSVLMTRPAVQDELARIYKVHGLAAVAWRNLHESASMFTEWADVCILNRSPQGIIDRLTGIAVLIGLLIALGQARVDALLLVIWIAAVFTLGVAITDAPRSSYRLGPAMPALMMLAAFGIERTLLLRLPRRRWYRMTVLPALLIGMATWVTLENYQAFFIDYSQKGDGRIFPVAGTWRFAYEHCDGRNLYFVAAPESLGSEVYLDVLCPQHFQLLPERIPAGVEMDRPATFIVTAWARNALERLKQCYPNGTVVERRSDDMRYLFTTVEVATAELADAARRCGPGTAGKLRIPHPPTAGDRP